MMRSALFLLMLALPAALAGAQTTITVCPDGSCDHTELQPAIDSIPPGGTAEILVSAGTYVDGGLTFGGVTVAIKGLDGAEDTILTQSGTQRIMRIGPGNDVRIDGLTIRDGVAATFNDEGGGIRVASGASFTMTNCIIRENESLGDGAGVWIADGADASISDCQFIDNEITGPGGDGGGLYLGWIDGGTLERCGFHRNVATGNGGGLYQARGSQPVLTAEFCQLRNSVFWANVSGGIGGAAVVEPALTDCTTPRVIGYVTNCTFFRNNGAYSGGIDGHQPAWCGSPGAGAGLSIFVFNSILRQNEPVSILVNRPTFRGCSIDHLTQAEALALEGNNLNPQLLGDTQDLETSPPDVFDARLTPESFMIERGIVSYAGVPVDPGSFDSRGGDRLYDDPNTPNDGSSLLDIGAVEYDVADLEDLDDELGIGIAIWSGDAGNNLFEDPLNWYGSDPPDAGRGWLINDPELTVELPDSSVKGGAAVLGTLASFRGRLNLVSPVGGTSLLQVPQNDTLAFQSGIYLGLVYPSILNLDESVTIETDVLEASRARILLNGGTITVDDAVRLNPDQSEAPGPDGLRISTLHGPGTIQRSGATAKTFDPVLINNGRLRVDDLLVIEGDYEQTAGTLKFQSRIGDPLPSLDRRLQINGRAKLGGTVVFDVGPGAWAPEIGACYPVVTASEGFEVGHEGFDFVVTRWSSDPQNRFFVLSTQPCEEALRSGGGSETVNAVVVSLDALQSQNEALQSAGVVLRDLLMVDVDGNGFEDMVLSIDGGGANGQVVVLLNQGLSGTNQWQGFQPFGSVTGITVGADPRGLDAGYFALGSTAGGNPDLVVASRSGTVSVLRNLSTQGATDFSVLQTIDLVNGEPASDGVNPQPIAVCALNFDEDPCGLSDLAIACLDNSIWTLQNLYNCDPLLNGSGTDPLGNSNEQEDATDEPVTKFVPGLGAGGGKRNEKPVATGSSKEAGEVDSASKDSAFSGVGFTLVLTPHPVLAGSEIVDIDRGDLDGDGDKDVVVANRGDDSFAILLADGLESYAPAVIIELEEDFIETDSVTLADLEGDGDLDIALVCRNVLSGQRVARVVRNTLVEQGALGWVFDAAELLAGEEPYLLRASDVNADGVDDLVALTENSSFTDGPGNFGFAAVGVAVVPPCVGDLDGDGSVGGSDLALLLGEWGACSGSCVADLDDSGFVDGADLAALLGAWGPCGPALD